MCTFDGTYCLSELCKYNISGHRVIDMPICEGARPRQHSTIVIRDRVALTKRREQTETEFDRDKKILFEMGFGVGKAEERLTELL